MAQWHCRFTSGDSVRSGDIGISWISLSSLVSTSVPLTPPRPRLISLTVSVDDVKHHVYLSWWLTESVQARSRAAGELPPGRRWTLSMKLAGPLRLKSSRAGRRWCWAGAELDFFCFNCFPTAELRTLSLWLFCTAVGTTIASGGVVRWSLGAGECRTRDIWRIGK